MSRHKRRLMSHMLNCSIGSSKEGSPWAPVSAAVPMEGQAPCRDSQQDSAEVLRKILGYHIQHWQSERTEISQANTMADCWEKSPFFCIAYKPQMMAIGNEDSKDETKHKETALEKMLCRSEFLWTWWGVQSITNTPLKEEATKPHHHFMSCVYDLQWYFTY